VYPKLSFCSQDFLPECRKYTEKCQNEETKFKITKHFLVKDKLQQKYWLDKN